MSIFTQVCGIAWAAASCCALAQTSVVKDYPTKSIRGIFAFAPGGPGDFTARAIGSKLSESLGQSVVIDNRAGASGTIGTALAAKAVPDGYTVFFGSGSALTVLPALMDKLPYDPVKDFEPIGMLTVNPQILIANNSLSANSIKELIALAKARPGELTFASGGAGSTPHLGMELLKSLAGINMVHVPYKGSAPALTDLMGGQVMLFFYSMQPAILSLIKAGKIKALAVSSAQRSRAAPDIPTVAEAGVANFENVAWFGLFAPAKTPQPIIARLNLLLVKILRDPETAQRFTDQGADPVPGPPQALTSYMRAESERLKKVIASAAIKLE